MGTSPLTAVRRGLLTARNMADLAPAQIYSLNLGLSEVGNKINQIQQQLDKTEHLVNNLSQIKLNQDTSLMFERQVQMEEPDPDAGQIADRDEAYLVQLPTVVLATVGTAVLSGILFSAITFLSDLVQCPNDTTNTNTTTALDAVTAGLCS